MAGWQRVTDAVRSRGGRAFAQLWQTGRASHMSLQADGIAPVSSTARASGGMAFACRPDGMRAVSRPKPPWTDGRW
ncbi:hypothetical protein GCM10017744_003300 [Streptomyces antimycoticus]